MENFKQWNEKMYSKYGNLNRIQGDNKYIRWFTNLRINAISNMLNDAREDSSLLDLGCGAGFTTRKILWDYLFYGDVTLVDVSKTAIKEAKILLSDYTIKYVCGNVELYEPRKKYSVIVCSEVLEHTPNPEKAINTIIKAANRDTIIIITIPDENVTNLIKKMALGFLGKPLDDWHIHKFNMKKIMQLTKGKLKLIDKKAIPVGLMPITYILKFKLI